MGEIGDEAEVEATTSALIDESGEAAVHVPVDALSEDALRGLLEEFASRDGTDYGDVERSLESKVSELRAQLARGEIAIVFDPESERTQLVAVE